MGIAKRQPHIQENNYIFKYSPRPGTIAIDRFPDDVPTEVKKARNNALLALQAEISENVHQKWVGREVDVFFERLTHRKPDGSRKVSALDQRVQLGWSKPEQPTIQVRGRTPGDLITCIEAPSEEAAKSLLGQCKRVKITESGPLLLRGELLTKNAS